MPTLLSCLMHFHLSVYLCCNLLFNVPCIFDNMKVVLLYFRKIPLNVVGKPRRILRRSPPQHVSRDERERLVNMASKLIVATVRGFFNFKCLKEVIESAVKYMSTVIAFVYSCERIRCQLTAFMCGLLPKHVFER